MREKSEKPSELSFVSTIAEASFLVKRIAEPCPAGDSTKAAIRRAWKRIAGWSFNRVKDIWYADARIAVDQNEVEYLRRVAAMAKREAEAADVRTELQLIRQQIARIDELLGLRFSDADSETLAQVRAAGRGPHSAMD